jgi:hypothetical protein
MRNYHYSLRNSPEEHSSPIFLWFNAFILFLSLSFAIVLNISDKKEIFFKRTFPRERGADITSSLKIHDGSKFT